VIPRTIHHVWFGPRPVPEDWATAWRNMHPGWEHRVWREADVRALPMRNRELFDDLLAKGVWHGAADVARLEILHAVGGVYVDIDSKPLRSLEGAPFLDADVFAAYEPPNPHLPGRVANGTIGAVPGSEAIDEARRIQGAMHVVDPPWATIGAPALTDALAAHQRCCDVRILPARTFYRTNWRGQPVPGKEPSYIEHFWATTNHGYPARAVVLVPRRAGVPERDAIWAWCRRIWEQQGWPVFEGHHDEPGLFNASKARNAAAQAAGDWDVAIFADADTVPWDWRSVREAVGVAARTGHFVRPFRTYHMLDEEASRSFMETGVLPKRGMRWLRESAYGGIHVVPRRLWDASGGYDERFLGWGSEDAAFEFACRVLGGFTRLPGDVYHLWHPMQQRDPSTPQFQANVALGARYRAIRRPSAMRALIAERNSGPPLAPQVGAIVTTDGRRDCIERTIPSLEAMVGPFTDRVICDDSGDPAYAAWLTVTFPEWRVRAHKRLGHGPAIAFAIGEAAKLDADWVFWSEDDIEYLQRVDVAAMAAVMDAEPDLKQMVVKRQAWFPRELEAGGMIERFDPGLFVEHDGASPWIEHRQFYSLNPHLVRRELLEVIAARRQWPAVPNSEHHYAQRLFRNPLAKSGIWGRKTDAPWIRHFGERIGMGY